MCVCVHMSVCVFTTKTPALCLEVIIASSPLPPYDVIGVFLHDGSRFSVGFGGIFSSLLLIHSHSSNLLLYSLLFSYPHANQLIWNSIRSENDQSIRCALCCGMGNVYDCKGVFYSYMVKRGSEVGSVSNTAMGPPPASTYCWNNNLKLNIFFHNTMPTFAYSPIENTHCGKTSVLENWEEFCFFFWIKWLDSRKLLPL